MKLGTVVLALWATAATWYIIDEDRCVATDGPANHIKRAGRAADLFEIHDTVEQGEVVEVSMVMRPYGHIRYFRGRDRCERARKTDLNRYR